jgi:hypothetical protein
VGIRSGKSWGCSTSAGWAVYGARGGISKASDLGTVGPSRNDLTWGSYPKSSGAERGSPLSSTQIFVDRTLLISLAFPCFLSASILL